MWRQAGCSSHAHRFWKRLVWLGSGLNVLWGTIFLRRSWGQPDRCNGAWDVGVLCYGMCLHGGHYEVTEVGWRLHFGLERP